MPRFHHILNRFTGGEVAPEVWGRTDSDQWPTMLERARNVFLNPRGGVVRRPGLHYVRPTKFPQGHSRLIPFIFSREQSYILEFGDYYVRFYKDDGWVEDIGAVTTYLGDGSSTNFVYPHADVAEADIEVYDKNGNLVPNTEYTVTAIDPATNYMKPFSDAEWNVDVDATGNPWVKNAAQISSPTGLETVMGDEDAQVPIGGAYKYEVDVVSVTDTAENIVDSNTAVIPLVNNAAYIEIANVSAFETVSKTVKISAQCQFEDTSGTRTSDFFWEIRKNDEILSEGTELLVGTPGFFFNTTANVAGLVSGDTITLHVRAVGSHATQSAPQITGTANATSVSISYEINADAQLFWSVENTGGDKQGDGIDPVVGTLTLHDSQETTTVPAPYGFYFYTERGLDITLENPSLKFNNTGYVITFNTAPVLGDIVTIKDGSYVSETRELVVHTQLGLQGVARAGVAPLVSPDIFEIQSPYAEADLDELYFAQANDVMVICHERYKPRELTRYNPYDWRFEQNAFTGAPWEDGGYSPLKGYPRTVAYYQERLYFGGTTSAPQTLWGSRSADFHDFTPDITDPLPPDAPVIYTIAAYTHEAIEWLSSERVLIIGTSATEHRLAPDQYIATDRLPTVSRMSAYGGAHIMPAFMGNLTVFVQTAENQVRTFEQSAQTVIEKWDSLELDWKAKHLTAPKVKQITYALNPYSILMMVTHEGDMLTMTYEPNMGESSEVGWTQQETDGDFISVAVIPEDDKDQGWVIIDREVNGINQKYVEFYDEHIFTDSSLEYPDPDFPDDPPVQSVSGLNHLEGKTVTIKVDGSTHPDMVVVDGQVVLNDYYQHIDIGLKYIPEIKLQRLAIAGEQANLQGQLGRWSEVWLRLVDSAYPLVDGVRSAERQGRTPMDTVEPIVTGDVKGYHLGWDREKQLTITQDLPVPLQITAIFGVVSSNQG